jgi:riboflavin kinase
MTGIYFGFAQLHPTTSSSSSSSSSALDATSSAPNGTLSKEDIENLPDHTAAYPQAQKEAEHIDTNSEQAPSSSTISTESSSTRDKTEPKLQKEDYDVWPMVMSVGYNPYYKNKELTAVSVDLELVLVYFCSV